MNRDRGTGFMVRSFQLGKKRHIDAPLRNLLYMRRILAGYRRASYAIRFRPLRIPILV
jgi:hypothetical protein